MQLHRRDLLTMLGALPLLSLSGTVRAGGEAGLYLSANALPDGTYRVAAVAPDGARLFELPLPGRGHGFAVDSIGRHAVAFARRPGTFAVAFDTRDGAVGARLSAPPGRHFYGHGAFSTDGATLFTTENDYASGRGVIGLWNATGGYRRIGEFASYGIGPHELVMAPDGRTLIAANGGIRTHPDAGREKLNIPDMDPSLAYIDSRDGRLLSRHEFAEPRHKLLSIRHLAVNGDGVVCIALQDQGPPDEALPLVAFHRAGEDALDLRAAPLGLTRRLHGYMGSAAMDSAGRIAAVSAPRGDRITFWDVARRTCLGAVRVADGCGVAATGTPGRFLATSGVGGGLGIDGTGGEAERLAAPYLMHRRWDNHLMAVALKP